MKSIIIDDHGLFRAGIGHVLKAIDSNTSIQQFACVNAALDEISDKRSIDLVMLDLHLPGSQYADNIIACRDSFELAKIIMVSGDTDGEKIKHSIELGAAGFIPKSADTQRLANALELVVVGGVYLPPELLSYLREDGTQQAVDPPSLLDLTERQRQALALAITGVSNAVICQELGLKLPTVKQHLRSAYQRLGVHNRTQAVAKCAELGGLEAPYNVSKHG